MDSKRYWQRGKLLSSSDPANTDDADVQIIHWYPALQFQRDASPGGLSIGLLSCCGEAVEESFVGWMIPQPQFVNPGTAERGCAGRLRALQNGKFRAR